MRTDRQTDRPKCVTLALLSGSKSKDNSTTHTGVCARVCVCAYVRAFSHSLILVVGLIIDAFGELRDQLAQVQEDLEVSQTTACQHACVHTRACTEHLNSSPAPFPNYFKVSRRFSRSLAEFWQNLCLTERSPEMSCVIVKIIVQHTQMCDCVCVRVYVCVLLQSTEYHTPICCSS